MAEPIFAHLVETGPWAGWLRWQEPIADTFLDRMGPSYSRMDAPGRATVMMETRPDHANRLGALHGGFLASFADHAYFAGLTAMGRPEQSAAVTVELSMQYHDRGLAGPAIAAEVEQLHETGRMIFMRLTLRQGERMIGASTIVIRKAQPAK